MTVNERFFLGFKAAKQLYEGMFAGLCRENALNQLQMDVLLFLANNPEYDTAQNICDLRGLAKSNVSNAVEALVQRGLLDRRTDAKNRRVIHLRIQPTAEQLIAAAQACQRAFFSLLVAGLSEQELDAARKLFVHMHENIRRGLERRERA